MALGREYRVVLGSVAALVVVTIAGTVWYWASPDRHRLDVTAAGKIAEFCGYRAECKIKLGDMFEGDWDRLYVLGAGVGQTEADSMLGAGKVRVAAGAWTLVLMRGVRVVATEAGSPDSRVEFLAEHHRDRRALQGSREDWVWANRYERSGGEYYVLSPDDR